jgi:hypothetical protein
MLKKYLIGGFKALVHGNRGKASQRRIPREVSGLLSKFIKQDICNLTLLILRKN